jgi:hypothetical protein
MNVGTELNKRGLSNEELTSSTFNFYPFFWEREIEFTRRNGFLEIPDHTPDWVIDELAKAIRKHKRGDEPKVITSY